MKTNEALPFPILTGHLARLVNTGVRHYLKEYDKRRIRVLNLLNLAILAIFTCFITKEIIESGIHKQVVMGAALIFPASIISLLLTSEGRFTAAKLVTIIGNITVLLYFNLELGFKGMELGGLIGMTGAIFLFQNRLLVFGTALFSVAAFLVLDGDSEALASGRIPVALWYRLMGIFLIFLILYAIRHEIARFHKSLSLQKKLVLARNNELNDLNNLKTKLFSILSHDLKGPLSAFELYMKEIKNTKMDPEEFQKMCPELLKNVETMNLLIQNLLRWSQDEMTKKPLNIERLDISDKIAENFRVLELQCAAKKIRLRLEAPSRRLTVMADANVIDTVLRNLISNAIKFSHPGGTICVYVIAIGNTVTVCVEDSGKGMTPAQVEGINRNAGNTTYGTHLEKGSGLGLILIRQLLQKQGSDLQVESQLDKGTRMSFELKLANSLSVAV